MNNNYTEQLNNDLTSLHNEYNDGSLCSEQDLLNYLSNNFAPFSEGIARFIVKYVSSFDGDIKNHDDLYTFIINQYQKINFEINKKTIHNWFYKNTFPAYTPKGRRAMYALCFSLGFSYEITKQFFRKVYFDRSFDCHNMEEAVYYYCFKNGLSYKDSVSILSACPNLTNYIINNDGNIIYTEQIQNKISTIGSENELINYLTKNLSLFASTKQSALRVYSELMSEIAVPKDKKKLVLSQLKNKQYKEIQYLTILDYYISECYIDSDEVLNELTKADISSASYIMKQILGFDIKTHTQNEGKTRYYNNRINDKNISKLPAIVRQNFPCQNKIYLEKNWEKASYDSLRKLIILLYFYKFCVESELEWKDLHKLPIDEFSETFISQANSRLQEAGFEELYIGNPYDWLYIFSSKTDNPLSTFRLLYYSSIVDEDEEEL